MNKVIFLTLVVLASCATPLSKKESTFVFIEKTNLSDINGYTMTLAYLAKSLGNSNKAIQLKDKENKRLISQIGISCDEIKNGFMDIASYTTYFTVDVSFKDNKVRLEISGDYYSSKNIDGSFIHVNSPYESSRGEGLKKCAEMLKDEIMAALNVKQDSNW